MEIPISEVPLPKLYYEIGIIYFCKSFVQSDTQIKTASAEWQCGLMLKFRWLILKFSPLMFKWCYHQLSHVKIIKCNHHDMLIKLHLAKVQDKFTKFIVDFWHLTKNICDVFKFVYPRVFDMETCQREKKVDNRYTTHRVRHVLKIQSTLLYSKISVTSQIF